MVQVSYPGVYIQEVPSGVHTITGVATSIAAFFGQAKEGPVDKAVRLLSYADYQRTYGPPHPDSELETAVRLFFQNGGTQCYVVRLVKKGTGAKASLVVKNEAANRNVLRFTAKEIGTWGNELALEVDYRTSNPEDTLHLRVRRIAADGTVKDTEEFLNCSMDPDSSSYPPNRVTQGSKLVDCAEMSGPAAAARGYSESRRPITKDELANLIQAGSDTTKFKLSVDGSAFADIDLEGAFMAGVTDAAALSGIKGKINDGLPPNLINTVTPKFDEIIAGVGGAQPVVVLRLESATPDKKSVVVQPGSSKDLTGELRLGTDQGGVEPSRFASVRPASTGIFLKFADLNSLAVLQQDDFNEVTLDGDETVDLVDDYAVQTTAAADKWYQAAGGGFDGVREKLAIIASAINDKGIGWDARVPGSRLLLENRSVPNHAVGTIATGPNDHAGFFGTNTRYYSLGTSVGTFQGAATAGVEGDPPDVASYKGKEDGHSGLYALDLVDIFNLMVIPKDRNNLTEEEHRSLWGPASAYCLAHRAFLLIDPPDSWSPDYRTVTDDATKGIRKLRQGVVKDHSAVFYPRLTVRENGLPRTVGPAGAIAGLMARIDSERGIWKAPAGVEADFIAISGLDVLLTDMENGVLNKQGVNCLRSFPSGIVNWGARTMDGADDFGSEWKYISIRRFALFLEESLFRGTKWIVFAANDEPLWGKIRLNLNAFMMGLFRQGAFQGSTPDQAFYVKCDSETTTQADRNLGIVNIEVGFAPLKPAEFVVIKIQQIAGDL